MNSVNELQLLNAFMPFLPENDEVLTGPGDDCAVLKWNSEFDLIVTVDQLIEDIHFLPETSGEAAGAKLVKRNLSDIAAMGGTPLWGVLTLGASEKSQEYLLSFMKGAAAECARYNVALCGGDISSLPQKGLVTTFTLAGRVPAGRAVLRTGAAPGETLYVTGPIGNSFDSGHHLHFTPRLDLAEFMLKKASAMLDISDGLLLDAKRMAAASGVDLLIDPGTVPLRTGAKLPDALSDGEDYELLFCGKGGLPFPAIGKVLPGTGKVTVAGFEEITSYGYEH